MKLLPNLPFFLIIGIFGEELVKDSRVAEGLQKLEARQQRVVALGVGIRDLLK